MNHLKIITILSTAMLLSSCGPYTNYHRSETLPVDSLYRNLPTAMQDTASLAQLSWRELFSDSVLVKWIDLGLQKNSNLQIARLRTEEAQASLQASRLAFLPSVSLTSQGSLSSLDGENTSKTYSLGGTAEWEIDAFGKMRNAQKGSYAALQASKAYEQAVQTQLVATIAETYYCLLALDRKLAISQETALLWGENVRVMKALKGAGQKNDIAVAQAEASRLDAESTVLSLKQQIYELENSFSNLLGIAPSEIKRGCLLKLSFNEKLSVGVPIQLLSSRPDVQQAEWQLAQAFYATNEARSAFYPQISLTGSAGWTNNAGANITNPGACLLSAVGSLVQPLFQRGRNIANLKIAKAQQEQAQIAFTQKI